MNGKLPPMIPALRLPPPTLTQLYPPPGTPIYIQAAPGGGLMRWVNPATRAVIARASDTQDIATAELASE